MDQKKIQSRALHFLTELLRFDTTNPPGNEQIAINYIARILTEESIPFQILARDPKRPNLIAELEGANESEPILLSSHVDVVPVQEPALWKYPPFSGTVAEGYIWGRGAIDMKYKTAFDLAAMIEFKSAPKPLKRKLRLIALSDEEVNGEFGAAFVCSQHRALIEGSLVFNEVGGFRTRLMGKDLVLIQAGEKSCCHLLIHTQGPTAHASVEYPGNCIVLLARVLTHIRDNFFSFRACSASTGFFENLSRMQSKPVSDLLLALTKAEQCRQALAQIPNAIERVQFSAMVSNTLNPTKLNAGYKINVIPENAYAECDCRLIPGVTAETFASELRQFLDREFPAERDCIRLEIKAFESGYSLPIEGEVFDTIRQSVDDLWGPQIGEVATLPYLVPAATDSTKYAAIGLKPYGFAPLLFPPDFDGYGQLHAINERIPVSAFEEGLACYLQVLKKLLAVN